MAGPQTATAGTGPQASRIESRSPATQRLLGSVLATPPDLVEAEVTASREVQPLFALLRIADRARYVRRMAQGAIDELDDLVEILGEEGGRPRAEVLTLEILPAIDALIWLAEKGPGLLCGRKVRAHRSLAPFKRAVTEQEPYGVIAVIGAGSAPLSQPLGQIGAALLAGNGVVFKPAARACLAGDAIGRIVRRAGLPEGLVRIVHGDASTGIALAKSPVEKVLFTGSPEVGRQVAQECVVRHKEISLELGGRDAMLVLRDADLRRAVSGAVWAGTVAAGQARGAVKRVYVAEELERRFVQRLVSGVEGLRVGDPRDPLTQVGPLGSQRRLQHVQELVDEAVSQGARLLCGGPLAEMPPVHGGEGAHCQGAFYRPAVLLGVTQEMRIMREQVHGPVVVVASFSSVEEGIALVNEGEHGLGASVWASDRHGALRVARNIDAGMVWVNDHLPQPIVSGGPWGAVAGGGLGRTLGEAGLRQCAQEKLITWDPARGRGLWWGPYRPEVERAAKAAARLRSSRDLDRSRAWREGALSLLRVGARAIARR